MVNLLGGSEQMISMILVITKAKVVSINKDQSKGMINKMGQKFRLYWMEGYSSKYRKEKPLGNIKKSWLSKLYGCRSNIVK